MPNCAAPFSFSQSDFSQSDVPILTCPFPQPGTACRHTARRQSTTSKRSDCGGWAHSSSAPAMATARSGLARQAS